MVSIGYTMTCEQRSPKELVRDAVLAEAAGFDFSVISEHYDVEGARLFDLPPSRPPLGIAVSGKQSCGLVGRLADLVVATEPKAEPVPQFRQAGGAGKPAVGQITVC